MPRKIVGFPFLISLPRQVFQASNTGFIASINQWINSKTPFSNHFRDETRTSQECCRIGI